LIAARGVHHLAIQVRDLAVVERFYREVLGLAPLRRWPSAGGAGERSVWMDLGDGAFLALEVIAPGDGEEDRSGDDDAGPRAGLHLLALRIGAAERGAWEERLARAGVAVYHRTAFTLYVRDPEGNRVGLSHFPEADAGTAAERG
jgi:catechol 2,3-dioxygenase-like lactoylglutathione lyase family enzyme